MLSLINFKTQAEFLIKENKHLDLVGNIKRSTLVAKLVKPWCTNQC